jgi:hypothetical protein
MTRLVAGVGLVLLALGTGVVVGCADDDAPGVEAAEVGAAADWTFTIPTGAGERIDAGEPLEILPAELEVRVGEVLRIRNEDDRGHVIGPFFVGAGETLTQRFASAGEITGDCSVHPSGRLVLRVLP